MSPDSPQCLPTLVANMSWRTQTECTLSPPRELADARATQKKCDFRSFSLGPATSWLKQGGAVNCTTVQLFKQGGVLSQLYKIGFLKIQPRVITASAPSHKNWYKIFSKARVARFHNSSDVGNKNWVQLLDWVGVQFDLHWRFGADWRCQARTGMTIHQLSIFQPQSNSTSIFLLRDKYGFNLHWVQFSLGKLFFLSDISPVFSSRYVLEPRTWMTATCFGSSAIQCLHLFRHSKIHRNVSFFYELCVFFWLFSALYAAWTLATMINIDRHV